MEEELANAILGSSEDEDKFEITYLGIKIKVGIKPLSPKKLIAISKFLCRLKELKDEGQTVFHAMTENASDLKLVCHAIATATNFPFKRFVYLAIMQCPLKDIQIMLNILVKQANADFFLSILALAKSQNILKKKKK